MEYNQRMFYDGQSFTTAYHHAGEQFRSLHQRAVWHRLWSALIGRRHNLPNLYDMSKGTNGVQERAYAGLHPVPVAQIYGSEGRRADFDADFRPLKTYNRDRWVRVAVAHSQEVALPAVELVQVDDRYFVRDGHHRISVAKMMGQQEIEAEVTVWRGASLSENQMENYAMNLPPYELSKWANQRLQEKIREGQADFAYQRRIEQQLGNVLRWLGQQFTIRLNGRRLRSHERAWKPTGQAPC
jgi:hypothetical protein